MAQISIDVAGAGVAGRSNSISVGFFDRIRAALIRARVYRRSMGELTKLDDRMLKDIAVCRGDIREVAEAAAERAVAKFLASRA